ncbi:MAG TPA: hypothetical protein VFD28_00110 [Candidatus Eisenbacteria bacterium]|nr:hypothetical protein [Candidatus Eisenbacteria bacterium]
MAELLDFKCPSCGGAVIFDSQSQLMKCSYCGTEYDQTILQQYDHALKNMPREDDYSWNIETQNEWDQAEDENLAVYVCNSCGGEIVGDPTTVATSCPYCDNPVVVGGQVAGDLKPDLLIPFQLTKEQAKDALRQHMTGKRFLPKSFKSEKHIEKIRGIYVPFWVFDTDVNADFRYRASKRRSWSDRNYIYTETRNYSLLRSGTIGFTQVPVDASSKMPDDLMQSIEPFDLSQSVVFNVGYLSGYLADRYDEDAESCIDRANQRIEESTVQAFSSTVGGYESVQAESASIKLSNGVARYVLYPVWVLYSKYENNDYIFAMNGQTGRFVGDLPLDKKAARLWLFILFLIFFVISYGGAWLIHFLL